MVKSMREWYSYRLSPHLIGVLQVILYKIYRISSNSSANPAHLPQRWAKWAELAVLYVQNSPHDFDFFNCDGCQTFILAEIYFYLSALKS